MYIEGFSAQLDTLAETPSSCMTERKPLLSFSISAFVGAMTITLRLSARALSQSATGLKNWRVYTAEMAITDVLAQIDAEIARLQQAKAILSESGAVAKPGRGRPKNTAAVTPASTRKKRNVSPEGRARIAAAVKRRWAAQKKLEKSKS